MPRCSILLAPIAVVLAGLASADAQQHQPSPPCAAIRQVCVQAGFMLNGARAGEGLVVHCIRPLMQDTPQPKRATRSLPAVDPALIEACRARNPDFGVSDAQALQPMPPRNEEPRAAPSMASQDTPPPDELEPAPPEEPAPKQ